LSHYTAKACVKLRKQKSRASGIYVFLQTNQSRNNDKQYGNALTCTFEKPSSDSGYIIKIAKKSLRKIYRHGYQYHKTGIMLLNLIPDTLNQLDLFYLEGKDKKSDIVMKTMDDINHSMGRSTIQFCAEGIIKTWQIRCNKRSPRYTTRIKELKIVICD
jgi:DNA polymerase V